MNKNKKQINYKRNIYNKDMENKKNKYLNIKIVVLNINQIKL